MKKLISIDLFADFGMLKKPDTNEPVYLTFNMLHKPALLGILGAITGLEGFKEKGKLPEYYEELKDLKVGVQPIDKDEKTGKVYHENGNFQKSMVKYNNATGLANMGEEDVVDEHTGKIKKKKEGATLNIIEQFLIAPAFRCYFLFETDNELHQKIDENLRNYHAEYLPYLGKNEFSVWWKGYETYDFEVFEPTETFKINSIYIKDQPLEEGKEIQYFNPVFDAVLKGNTFSYFERLPVAYIDIGKNNYQYEYRNFAFTDWDLQKNYQIKNELLKINGTEIIQVF